MYNTNFLASVLRKASIGHDQSLFANDVDHSTNISYGTLFKNAEVIASVLQANGLKPGDRVAVQIGKSITGVELYLATILAGGVFLPLNTDYTANEIEYFLADASPRIFVCSPDRVQGFEGIAKQAGVSNLLSLSNDGLQGSLCEQMLHTTQPYTSVERSADDLAAILYTSGTTGRSKGAMLSHGALAANALTLADYWQFTRDDRLIHALPIFHIHGLFVAINITLCAGSSLNFMSKFNAEQIIALFNSSSVLMGVPTFYVRLLKQAQLSKQTVSNMRLFVSGSAPLLSETHSAWSDKTGLDILERYGMTETNMNTSNPYEGLRKPGTVGFALPGVEVKICNPDTGQELNDGEIGQIEVKGPNLFSGYWKMPEKTAEELRSTGWFLTGDLGTRDEQGYISIVGRSKDLIISGGYNVYPKEIESVIDDISGVDESAVIGIPHPDFGEAVVAVVVAENQAQQHELQDSITQSVADSLARFKRPKQLHFVNELPRNTMGKVQKAQLREQFQDLFKT
ncbi:malonyl-CoA synthase [Alginatibacterium sediminis]|uniref:Malonyl-CoA synthase n=1 Tax=Alginatibacterium sediminis TaxID=2164068 RepID=A0A420E741_9ALTE|nr:AMP-binding protein [Alginatibacterium sediminis]RKF14361.1 malonyl-CoA synthase [Alginatibacterium sediminis]